VLMRRRALQAGRGQRVGLRGDCAHRGRCVRVAAQRRQAWRKQEAVHLHHPVNPLVISGQHLALEDSVDTPVAVGWYATSVAKA